MDTAIEEKPASVSEETSASTAGGEQQAPFNLIFKVGEKILASHGPLRYVAKVLDVDPDKGYFIHYDGWKAKWDEWVTPDRVFENNEENLRIAQQMKNEVFAKVNKRSQSGDKTGSSSSKRKRDTSANDDGEDAQDEDGGEAGTTVRLNLPDDLKTIVVRDWEQLTQHKKLCVLPKPVDKTVEKILDDFVNTKKKVAVFSQISQGLLVYFDRALPSILLYRAERVQYEKLKAENPNKRNCELYGGEHLLRLFVRLPQLLANTDLDESETKQLCSRLQDLLRFLAKKTTEYFAEGDSGYTDNTSADANGDSS